MKESRFLQKQVHKLVWIQNSRCLLQEFAVCFTQTCLFKLEKHAHASETAWYNKNWFLLTLLVIFFILTLIITLVVLLKNKKIIKLHRSKGIYFDLDLKIYKKRKQNLQTLLKTIHWRIIDHSYKLR